MSGPSERFCRRAIRAKEPSIWRTASGEPLSTRQRFCHRHVANAVESRIQKVDDAFEVVVQGIRLVILKDDKARAELWQWRGNRKSVERLSVKRSDAFGLWHARRSDALPLDTLSVFGRPARFGQQIGDQMIEIFRGNDVAEVFGHKRGFSCSTLFYLLLRNGDFFPRRFGEHHHFSFLPPEESADYIAVIEREESVAKRAVHVSVRVQDILHDSLEATVANAVELRTDDVSNAVKLMANAAVLSEHLIAFCQIGFIRVVGSAAPVEEP
jgi:hypothetical protein